MRDGRSNRLSRVTPLSSSNLSSLPPSPPPPTPPPQPHPRLGSETYRQSPSLPSYSRAAPRPLCSRAQAPSFGRPPFPSPPVHREGLSPAPRTALVQQLSPSPHRVRREHTVGSPLSPAALLAVSPPPPRPDSLKSLPDGGRERHGEAQLGRERVEVGERLVHRLLRAARAACAREQVLQRRPLHGRQLEGSGVRGDVEQRGVRLWSAGWRGCGVRRRRSWREAV